MLLTKSQNIPPPGEKVLEKMFSSTTASMTVILVDAICPEIVPSGDAGRACCELLANTAISHCRLVLQQREIAVASLSQICRAVADLSRCRRNVAGNI
eukprot:121668-Amphidinium_carterae.1